MADHSKHGGSDTGAAFMGLIGGALFVGIVCYVIVQLTNKKFESHAPAGETSAVVTDVRAVA